jgi:hypothetical protein
MMNLYKNNKMKNFNKLFAIAVLSVITFSCVEDDDFNLPDTAAIDIEAPANLIDMSSVIGQIGQSQTGTVTFDNNEQFIEGYVISSDEAGNFFEELIIQDAIENPTAGIKVLIDNSPLFTTYTSGQRIYVRLGGLSASIANGVPVLGINGSGFIEKIAPSQQETFILRDSEIFDIVPTQVSGSSAFSTSPLLTLIQLPEAQFLDDDINDRITFAAEPTDQFDGVRLVQTCGDFSAAPIRLETSTFSDFKSLRLPDGSGSITAVLQRDFRDDFFVIAVNSPEDFSFDANVRCDFAIVSCGTVSAEGSNILLTENFETQSTGTAAMPTGWTNFVEAGSVAWEIFTDGNSLGKSARVRPFRSNDVSNIAWLITPQFDFDAQTGEVITFQSSFDFFDSSVNMQALFSSDWDGTAAGIATATWEPLADAIIADENLPLDHDFDEWPTSGNVSLDCVSGTGAIAFRYVGSGDGSNDVTYELDNISLTSD